MLSLLLELKTECTYCGNPLPVNAFVEKIFCDKCNKDNVLDAKLWSSLLEDKLKEILAFEDSVGRPSKVMMGQYTFDMLYGRKNARCNSCKTDIPDEELNKFTDKGKYKCANCSKEVFVRPATDLLKSILKSAKYIVSEDENLLFPSSEKPLNQGSDKPIMFTCPSCAGNLEVDGKERIIVCKYCQSKVYLPDDLWFSLHPVISKERWYITFDNKVVAEMLPEWTTLYDAAIDREGNLYFATKLDTFDEGLTIWSCSPDFKKRWSINNLKIDKEHSHIAITKNGDLYVWAHTNHSLYVLSGKDGSIIKKIKGSPATKDDPYTFSLNECEALISDSDETILVLINSTFVRFNSDGTRTSLWGSVSEGESQGFFSKMFSGSDDKIKIPESEPEDDYPLEKSGDKPRNVDSADTKMFIGWENFIYVYHIRDGIIDIAKYNRSGEQMWKKKIELKETGEKICADGKGNIYVAGLDENEKSILLRLSADGETTDVILKDITEGGTFRFDDGDMVLVSLEGTIYTVNSSEQLRAFNPDFSVKYISKGCKEDDEDALEESKSEN